MQQDMFESLLYARPYMVKESWLTFDNSYITEQWYWYLTAWKAQETATNRGWYANILKFQFGLRKTISKLNEDATLPTENGFWFDYACKYLGEVVVM